MIPIIFLKTHNFSPQKDQKDRSFRLNAHYFWILIKCKFFKGKLGCMLYRNRLEGFGAEFASQRLSLQLPER